MISSIIPESVCTGLMVTKLCVIGASFNGVDRLRFPHFLFVFLFFLFIPFSYILAMFKFNCLSLIIILLAG